MAVDETLNVALSVSKKRRAMVVKEPDKLLGGHAMATIVGGKVVYQRQ